MSGIAVSGGVDSMALATLCSKLRQNRRRYPCYHEFTAFVVDHKAREGSGLEAIMVKTRLKRLNIHARILTLDWPPGVQPLKLPNFETQARRLRYQALGAACVVHNITTLLVAHHADDQAETILTRLSTGHKSIRLRGVRASAPIPECEGIHRVYQSGGYEFAAVDYHRRSSEDGHTLHLDSLGHGAQRILSSPPLVESGGVRILRPLLEFRKQDLINTCQAYGTAWSEDATNRDTWRTPRNATRTFLKSYSLPVALQTTSLVQLSSRMATRETNHEEYAARFNALCQPLLFDLRSGRLVVRLPKLPNGGIIGESGQGGLPVSLQLLAALLLRKLTNLVSPSQEATLNPLKRAVAVMFPSHEYTADAREDGNTESTAFTAAGVIFQRISSPLPDIDVASEPHIISEGRTICNQDLDTKFIWSLTRQPFANHLAEEKLGILETASTTRLIKGRQSCKGDALTPPDWSSWQLWDGRYWIRMKNLIDHPLKLRAFNQSDLHVIRTDSPTCIKKPLEKVLASAAPDKVRWTLPVIVQAEKTNLEKVIVLPTLGKAGMVDVENGEGKRKLEWEVRYKSVDLGRRREDGAGRNIDMMVSWEDS